MSDAVTRSRNKKKAAYQGRFGPLDMSDWPDVRDILRQEEEEKAARIAARRAAWKRAASIQIDDG